MNPDHDPEQARMILAKADAALRDGRITLQEHDALLRHYSRISNERKADEHETVAKLPDDQALPERKKRSEAFIALGLFIAFAVIVLVLYKGGSITGAVILDAEHPITAPVIADANTSIALELANATRVEIAGIVQGNGNAVISLREGRGGEVRVMHEYLHGGARTAHASMPKSRYTESETVAYAAVNVSSAYLMTGEQAIPLDAGNTSIAGLAPGSYIIKLIINDTGSGNETTLTQETLAFTIVAAGTPAASEAFNTCGSACDVNITANATLEIAIEGNVTVRIDNISVRTQANRPPQLVEQFAGQESGSPARIPLAGHFADPDGDALSFDISRHDGMDETVQDGTLIISGPPGTYTYIVYASDLRELTPSNIFAVTITASAENATKGGTKNGAENASVNITPVALPQENSTANITTNATAGIAANTSLERAAGNTTNATNSTADATFTCDDPDPNRRPVDCLNIDSSTYFDENLYWENVDRARVARFTKIGNLFIRGMVVEHDAAGEPAANDFAIGHSDWNFRQVTTIWIDAAGNLHLRGELHEENENLIPAPNTRAFMNRRGVYLAYADPVKGDLYLRGNVIGSREDIDG